MLEQIENLLLWGMCSLLLVPIFGPISAIIDLTTREGLRGPKFLQYFLPIPVLCIVLFVVSTLGLGFIHGVQVFLNPEIRYAVRMLIGALMMLAVLYMINMCAALYFLRRNMNPWTCTLARDGLILYLCAFFAKVYGSEDFYRNPKIIEQVDREI